MTTVRIAKRHRYTQVDRRTINELGLSLRALGLLVWLLDKPDDWKVDSASIGRQVPEGREAIRTAMKELETAGCLVREQLRVRGRWATEVVVYEHPDAALPTLPTEAQKPVTVEPTEAQETDAGPPDAGKPGAVVPKDGDLNTETEKNPPAAPPSAAKELVDAFWKWCTAQGKPTPTLPSNGSGSPFMALVKIVQHLLDAGHASAAIKRALTTTSAFTINALTLELNRQRPPAASARAPITGDRERPSGVVSEL